MESDGQDGWCIQIDLRCCFLRNGVAGHEDGGGGKDGGMLHFEVGLVGGGFFDCLRYTFFCCFSLMSEKREEWLSTGIYVARGSFVREILTILCRHIDLSLQSSVMTPSYVLAITKTSRLGKSFHLIGSLHTDLKWSRQPRLTSRSAMREMSLRDAHVLRIMLCITTRISQSTVAGVIPFSIGRRSCCA